jgi:hypothetical protein
VPQIPTISETQVVLGTLSQLFTPTIKRDLLKLLEDETFEQSVKNLYNYFKNDQEKILNILGKILSDASDTEGFQRLLDIYFNLVVNNLSSDNASLVTSLLTRLEFHEYMLIIKLFDNLRKISERSQSILSADLEMAMIDMSDFESRFIILYEEIKKIMDDSYFKSIFNPKIFMLYKAMLDNFEDLTDIVTDNGLKTLYPFLPDNTIQSINLYTLSLHELLACIFQNSECRENLKFDEVYDIIVNFFKNVCYELQD